MSLVKFVRIVFGDEDPRPIEFAVFFWFFGWVKFSALGGVGDRQAHAALPERVPRDGGGEFSGPDRIDRNLDTVNTGDRYLPGQVFRPQRL
jgi:hypothetical protein